MKVLALLILFGFHPIELAKRIFYGTNNFFVNHIQPGPHMPKNTNFKGLPKP